MKKTNTTRFAKTALAVSKLTKQPVIYSDVNGAHTIACSYLFLRTDSAQAAQTILARIPASHLKIDCGIHSQAERILQGSKNRQTLTNSGIVVEGQYAYRRFLYGNDFVVTINDDYLYTFDGDYHFLAGDGSNSPVIVFGSDYIAGILPLAHRSNDAALATMHRVIERSGYKPINEEVPTHG